MESIKQEILELKKKHNALILAHYYEDGEIQDLADHTGDSLYLAQVGQKSDADVILLAGVVFMAESVKILSPQKTVLVPDINAGCSLVNHAPFEKYLKWRQKNPNGIAVTYINSSAEVKSISDVICTSSNAEKILNTIPKDRPILFGPDRNLGGYLSRKLDRPMELWPGACEVHVLFSAKKLYELRKQHPDALVLAHPECTEVVLEFADVIGSTSHLLNEVKTNPKQKFIIATESGILHEMQRSRPDATLIQAPVEGNCACNDCPYMKLNTLEKIRNSLLTLTPQMEISPNIAFKAKESLDRMMDITEGKDVHWPREFKHGDHTQTAGLV